MQDCFLDSSDLDKSESLYIEDEVPYLFLN